MDPLSITASIIATIQLTGKVTSILWGLRSAVQGAKGDIARIIGDVNSLRTILEALVNLVETVDREAPSFLSTWRILSAPDGPIQKCQAELKALEALLQFTDKHGLKHFTKPFQWFVKKDDANRRLEALAKIKSTLQLALTTDHM